MGCDIHAKIQVKENGVWVTQPFQLYRCYILFAQLADVRNRHGNNHIALKGLPRDCGCFEEEWDDCYYHSFNWTNLDELEAFYKENPKVKVEGYVSSKAAKELSEGIVPDTYWQSGNVTGQVFATWEEDNAYILEVIEMIKKKAGDKEHRLVFCFDN